MRSLQRLARSTYAILLLTLAAAELGRAQPSQETRADDPFGAVRAEFLEALNGARADAGAAQDGRALRAYALYPYLEAARIERALAAARSAPDAADARAAEFLDRHAAEPVTRELESAWLASLARREAWRAFLERYDPEAADEALRCRAFQARIALDRTAGIAPEIIETWLTGRQLPLECEPVFQWLRAQGLLTDELIEQRVVLLLENGQAAFARVIARRLPEAVAAPLLRWAALIETPERSIDALIEAPDAPVRWAALSSGWSRFSRDEPGAALARYEPLIAGLGLDAAQASKLALALALGLAWDRRPEALEYFERVADDDLDDYALAWRARAALWADDWRLAAASIAAMSPSQRDETRWLYWRARAAEKLRDRGEARELYRSILSRDNYYSAMAAARLGRPAEPHAEPLDADETVLERLAALPPFVRARELYYAGLPWSASAEWRYGFARLGEAGRDQSVHLAARWGWYDLAIATATGRGVFDAYRLLYPRPYSEAVRSAAQLTKLEPPLIYGLIRQESLYRRDAASRVGAVGLAQLMPDTARRIAADWGQPEPRWEDLLIPEINITLGAAKLRSLIDEFDEQIPVGLAGYNAGTNAARRWLPDRVMDSDVWIENIPYNETREFVQRVLWHSLVFAWLETGEPRSTEQWLAAISPNEPDRRQAER
jgi:soluble lytic murein transglycosylase